MELKLYSFFSTERAHIDIMVLHTSKELAKSVIENQFFLHTGKKELIDLDDINEQVLEPGEIVISTCGWFEDDSISSYDEIQDDLE